MSSTHLITQLAGTQLDEFTEPIQRVVSELPGDILPTGSGVLWKAPPKYRDSRYYTYHHGPLTGPNADQDPYNPSPFFALEYLPNGDDRNGSWVEATNFVCVEYSSSYRWTHDETPSKDSPTGSYPDRYFVSGAFVDPAITTEPEPVIEAVTDACSRIVKATDFNRDIQRLASSTHFRSLCRDFGETPATDDFELEDDNVYTSPIRRTSGVGATTDRRVAERVGTYANLRDADWGDISSATSSFEHGLSHQDLLDPVEIVLEMYAAAQTKPEWDGTSVDPMQWSDYPKEQFV